MEIWLLLEGPPGHTELVFIPQGIQVFPLWPHLTTELSELIIRGLD